MQKNKNGPNSTKYEEKSKEGDKKLPPPPEPRPGVCNVRWPTRAKRNTTADGVVAAKTAAGMEMTKLKTKSKRGRKSTKTALQDIKTSN